ANDNFKGVATLFGGGKAGYRGALAWATAATMAGSLASIFIAGELLRKFTGKGVVPDDLVGSGPFVLSVAGGASATVLAATRLGLPVSTTHALLGGLIGAGLAHAGPSAISTGGIVSGFMTPLLISPVVAAGMGAALSVLLRRLASSAAARACVCVEEWELAGEPAAATGLAFPTARVGPAIVVGRLGKECDEGQARVLFSAERTADALHWLSAGLVSFARGLNDTPKMAALLMVTPLLSPPLALAAVAIAIATGGLIAARGVARTISHRITRIDPHEGLAANATTSFLVITASVFALPVSTTHVSVGAIFGLAASDRSGDMAMIRNILLSWLATLPLAALAAFALARGISVVG
ncbi:MAG: inorganic phosphate transporter, partial [Caulobacteraceae bacterium]